MKVRDIIAAINEHGISMKGRFNRKDDDPVYFIYKTETEPSFGDHDFFEVKELTSAENSYINVTGFYSEFRTQYHGMALLLKNILNRATRTLYGKYSSELRMNPIQIKGRAITDSMTFDLTIMDVMEEYAKIFHWNFDDVVDERMMEVYVIKFSENIVNPGHLVIQQARYLGSIKVTPDTTMHYCIDQAGQVIYTALHPKYIFVKKDHVLYMADLFEKLYINRRGEYNNGY